jgi:hypothetical protein
LSLGSFLIDIDRRRPIPVTHLAWSGEGDHQNRIKIVEVGVSVSSSGDVKGERRIAAVAWSGGLDEASADEIAVARFKVFTNELPGFCHIVLLIGDTALPVPSW